MNCYINKKVIVLKRALEDLARITCQFNGNGYSNITHRVKEADLVPQGSSVFSALLSRERGGITRRCYPDYLGDGLLVYVTFVRKNHLIIRGVLTDEQIREIITKARYYLPQ